MTTPRLLPVGNDPAEWTPATLEGALIVRAALRFDAERAAARSKADLRVAQERLAAFAEVGADLLGMARLAWPVAQAITEALAEHPPTRGDEAHRERWQLAICEAVAGRLAD